MAAEAEAVQETAVADPPIHLYSQTCLVRIVLVRLHLERELQGISVELPHQPLQRQTEAMAL